MVKISGVIITYNEEKNIGRCLDSIKGVVDEIIVVDSFSNDKTEDICKAKGAIFIQHTFEGHIQQKNYALGKATHQYILSLDADEALSQELTQSILEAKKNWQADAYEFNRLLNYCGKWIRHCGWYPDKKVRLIDSTKAKWGGTNPHDKIILTEGAKVSFLKGDLYHYSYNSIHDHIKQINSFTDIMAREAVIKNKKISVLYLLVSPWIKFIKSYFIQLGILDGYYGFVICTLSSFATFIKYSKIRELKKKS
ncbi:MAG: glycosyltransferase family 2 protein [Cytophagaceae bacterium]|nr:glycosyltransferase family 2 protein [Cytophagaceae bacterium]